MDARGGHDGGGAADRGGDGGNRGMGLETCRHLGRRGYRVVLTSRETAAGEAAAAKLREEDGLEVECFRLDLTRAQDIAALVAHVRRRLARVYAVVNNAGIYLEFAGSTVRDRTSMFDAQLPVVRAIVETNLLGPFALSQGLVAMMRERGYGRVVNLVSAMGQFADTIRS